MNDPCYCGSGKLVGECCGPALIQKLAIQAEQAKFPAPELMKFQLGDFTGRIVWDRIHIRPKTEHLHEFMVNVLIWTLGEEWHREQVNKLPEERHAIMQWIYARYNFLTQAQSLNLTPRDRLRPTGEVMELMALASDVYYLQLVNKLPEPLIERLRNYEEFQGARYEIAVAASLVRVGFDIEWINAKVSKGEKLLKHCEFNAVHKASGETLAVEAKSRRRTGTLHERGNRPDFTTVKADIFRLYNKAMQQNPGDKPFGIFIDINLPHEADAPIPARQWIEDLLQKIEQGQEAVFGTAAPTIVVISNSAWHYEGETPAEKGEYMLFRPPHAPFQFENPLTVEAIWRALNVFSAIPDEE